MAKFFLLREQKGSGCDYSIGCGLTFEELRSTNQADALKEISGLSDNWKDEIIKGAANTGYSIGDYIHDYVISNSGLSDVASDDDGPHVDRITLFAVAETWDITSTLKGLLAEVKSFESEFHQHEKEKAERAQYEALKKKYDP